MTIEQITKVYENAELVVRSGIEIQSVHCKEVALFSQALANLAREIKSYDPGAVWEKYLITVRHLHKLLLTTPLSLSTLLEMKRDVLNDFWPKLMAARAGVPNVSVAYELWLEALELLKERKTNPLADAVQTWVASVGATTTVLLAIPKAGLMDLCRRALPECSTQLTWITPAEIRHSDLKDVLLFLGPPFYLVNDGTAHILRSPIASRIVNFNYSHLACHSFKWTHLNADRTLQARVVASHGQPHSISMNENVAKILLPPRTDWSALTSRKEDGAAGNHSELTLTCYPMGLSEGRYVFLDEGGKRWKLILGTGIQQMICRDVVKVPTRDLSEGDLIVLTTEPSGDLVRPHADQILGKDAVKYRTLQQRWKEALRYQVDKFGLQAIVQALKDKGSWIASPGNLRNWCGEQVIAPDNLEEDFEAILQLVNMSTLRNQLRDAVRKLRSAHLSAGMALQGQLLKILRGRDISPLFETGSLEVRGDDRGPTKTVFLIEEIGDEIAEVPLHRVNRIQRH